MATRKKPQANKLGSFEDELVLLTSEGLQLQRVSAGEIDIITYAREILEVKLWPTQSAILKALYKLPLTTGYWRDCLATDPIYDDEGEVLYELGELEAAGFEWDAMYDEREILENWKRSGKTTWVEGSKYNELVLECGMRGSKCVTGDTLVHTRQGLMRMDKLVRLSENFAKLPELSRQSGPALQPGEERILPLTVEIATRFGYRHTSHVLLRGAEAGRRIRLADGRELGMSLVHPILVQREGALSWVKSPDLVVGDLVATVSSFGRPDVGDADGSVTLVPIESIVDIVEPMYDVCVPNGHEFITNGIVSHNTSLTSIPATYEFYKLFRHDDPAKAMGLLKGSLILMMVLATGEDQAKDTLFAAIKGRIESSSFFKGFIDNDEIRVTSLEIYCPKKNLKIMAGHSNCVAKGTLIATNRGLVPIEEIVGEGEPNLNIPVRRWKALLPNGGQAPILMGHRKGRQDSIIARTQRGYEVEASKEHRFMTMRDGQLDWTPLGDLKEGSWVTLARGWQGGAAPFQSSVRMERHGQVLSVDKLGTDLARHVGHLVGDGSFTQNKEPGSFQLTCGNPEPLELAEALIKRHFIKNPPALYKQTAPSGKNALIKWDSIVHAEWFRSIGLERADVFRKKVPWAIMQGPSELRGAFLGGLIDTDGTVDTGRPRIRWTSASPGLGHTMQLLLLSLGIEASRFSFPRKEREREGRLSVEQAHDRVYIERAMLPIFQRLVGLTVGKKKEKLAEYVTDSKHVRGKPWVPYELVRDSVVALYDAAAAESRTVRQAWNKLKKDTLKPCLEPQVINYDLLKQVLDDVRYFMETKNEDGALKERYEALVWLNDTRPVWDRIVSLTPSQVELFDITVEEAHHFIANGFIVHNSGGLVGRTLMFFGLDEANRFGNEGKGGATGMELYANVGKGTMTLRSRGSKKFVISSAWMQGDMTEQLYELAEMKSKNILAFRLATWDVNPRFILLGEQHPEIQQEYATRPVEAQRDYGGVRPGASEAFFPEACITPAFRSPKHVVPIEKRYSYQGPEEMQYLTRLEIVIPADMQVDRYESYAHADPGLKNDSFGLVVARPERLANGRMRIIVDAVLEWRPKKTTTENWIVDYENVKENLFKMKSALRLTRVTTDHWNSAQILQQLQAGGIHAKIFKSSSFGQKIQKEIYTELRNWLNEGMVILPKLGTSPSVDRLHKELKELQLINGKRIDHPSGGCFTGDTKVPLLDGRELSFVELVAEYGDGTPFHVYSVDPLTQEMRVGVAYNPRLTKRNAPIVAVTLDNGEVIRCTADHRFMLRDGTYIEASNLLEGSSLMPLYRGVTDGTRFRMKGYETYMNPRDQKYYPTHWMVGEFKYGDTYRTQRGHGLVLHHTKGKTNNAPENLILMTNAEHSIAHREDLISKRSDPAFEAKRRERAVAYAQSQAGRDASRENLTKLWNDPDYRSMMVAVHAAIGKVTGPANITKYNKSEDKRAKMRIAQSGRTNSNARRDVTLEKIFELIPQCSSISNVAKALNCSRQTIQNIVKAEAKCKIVRTHSGLKVEAIETEVVTKHPVINHKVVSVIACGYEDVYDISVHEWENFALSAGVIVHNSKDLADCLAAVVYNLAKHHNRFGGMGTSATLASTSKVQRGGTVRQATTINQDLNRMRQEYGAPQNLPRVPTRSNWG